MTVPASAVLRVLARLSSGGRAATSAAPVNLRATDADAVWLDYATLAENWPGTSPLASPVRIEATAHVLRLAAIDRLHSEERVLRVGWGVLTGPAELGSKSTQLCTPLLSWPARLARPGGVGPQAFQWLEITSAGDAVLTPLVADRRVADDLIEQVDFGGRTLPDLTLDVASHAPRMVAWIHAATSAAGLGRVEVEGPAWDPLATSSRLKVAVSFVLYVDQRSETAGVGDRAGSLFDWAQVEGLDETAVAAMYGAEPAPAAPALEPVVSPLPLSATQQAVVTAARTMPVTVVSGPPGCGKTHAVAALALDAVARGESVLLATRSRYAAEVIGGMLRRAAGPTPVLFGDTELRRAIADELAGGLPQAPPRDELRRRERALADGVDGVQRVERAVAAALADEDAALRARAATELAAVHRVSAPALFDEAVDLGVVRRAVAAAGRDRRGLLVRWRTDRAVRRLRSLVGAEPDTPVRDIEAALRAAHDQRTSMRLELSGGTSLGGLRRLLADADAQARAAAAAWMDGVTSAGDRRSRGSRRAVADLASALRAGRATRRRLLAGIGGHELVRALPLWVGTLGDVDDLLPPVPGLFDVIVVDEASHVDQPLAAPALVRARRAVIAGDPRQLRHVSFVSTAQVESAVAAEGAQPLSGLLDVPRMSLFDVAAAATSVHWLDEHYRCAPHLIGFAGQRFYPERLALLTTHPSIADADCIDVSRVAGDRNSSGVNDVEVAAAVAHVRRRVDAGARSVGVISPFRAQADAIERAVLTEFTVEEITRAGLRIGTVHSFQGSECDELVVSFALSDADPATSWRFVNDPNLLAVLTTRARRSVHVITSAVTPPGLVAAYLRHADEPPTETRGEPVGDDWTAALADELRRGGERVRTGYPVGRWRLDLVMGDDKGAVALETRPHPDGVHAHVARWRTLDGAGWIMHDAYPTRFGHDPVRAAITLLGDLDHHRH